MARIDGARILLRPHNGHLQVLGRLIYEVLFGLFGGDNYWLSGLQICSASTACAVLFFVFAWRRIGRRSPRSTLRLAALPRLRQGSVPLALRPAHDLLRSPLGLGALLLLERDDRRGDVRSAVLLVLSVAMIEVGLCLHRRGPVAVLLSADRRRRLWILLGPLSSTALVDVGAEVRPVLNPPLQRPADAVEEANALAAVAGSRHRAQPDRGGGTSSR